METIEINNIKDLIEYLDYNKKSNLSVIQKAL